MTERGRPKLPEGDYVVVNTRIPKHLSVALHQVARTEQTSMTKLVSEMLTSALPERRAQRISILENEIEKLKKENK